MPEFSTPKKSCSACHEIKALTDFHVNNAKPDGRQHKCKVCAAKPKSPNWENWRETIGYIPQGNSPESCQLRARAVAKITGLPMHTEVSKALPKFYEFVATLDDEEHYELKLRLGFTAEKLAEPRQVPYNG